MAEKATIRKGYRWRLVILATIALALGGWFIYDGTVGYPQKQRAAQAWLHIKQKYGQNWPAHWAKIRRKHHWPVQPAVVTDWDIRTQFIYAAACLIFGLFAAMGFVRVSRRWIETDEIGLHTNRGLHVPWENIELLDKARWDKKGIAIVHYQQNGKSGRLTLDDWKYDAAATTAIVAQVEQKLGMSDQPATAQEKTVDQTQTS